MSEPVILLVEDTPSDAELALIAFRQISLSHKVVLVQDGAEALDYLFGSGDYAGRDKGDLPLFILLDLKLPKVDGFEVLRRVREDSTLKDVFVAVLTSSTETADKDKAINSGANLFLRKDVEFKKFVATMRTVKDLISQKLNLPSQ